MKNIVLTVIVICVALAAVCPAGSDVMDQYRARKGIKDSAVQNKGRVLHFPQDQSVGKVFVQDVNVRREIDSFFYWTNDGYEWDYHCPAKGNVRIPAGKLVKFITGWYRKPDPEDLAKLRPDDLHSLVVQCGLDKKLRADNSYMESVERLTGLKVLDISDSNITSRGLFKIPRLGELERLSLGEGITNSGMRVVANLKSLKALYLKGCRITDIGLEKICEDSSLAELALSGKKLSNEGLAHLRKIGTLKYLMIEGDNFTDAGMAHLKNVTSLKILHAGHAPMITDMGVKHLSEHPGLERISFHWNENITDRGVVYLKNMSSLKKLDIGHAQLTDRAIADLNQIGTLEYLHLPNTGLTDAGVMHLAELQNLKYLWVSGSSISPLTDKSLISVGKLKNLEELCIGGAGFSDEGMDYITGLGNLKELSLFKADLLTNNGLAKLGRLKSLTRLSLPRGAKISIAGLKSLNTLTNLKHLTIRKITQDNSVMDISGLTSLEAFTLILSDDAPFQDADLACLSNLKQLERLQLCSPGMGDESLSHLRGLTNLQLLFIGESNVTDAGLKQLANMHKLYRLTIRDGHFTDAGLKFLENLPALRNLELTSDFAFSNTAIQRLQNKKPNIYLNLMP